MPTSRDQPSQSDQMLGSLVVGNCAQLRMPLRARRCQPTGPDSRRSVENIVFMADLLLWQRIVSPITDGPSTPGFALILRAHGLIAVSAARRTLSLAAPIGEKKPDRGDPSTNDTERQLRPVSGQVPTFNSVQLRVCSTLP